MEVCIAEARAEDSNACVLRGMGRQPQPQGAAAAAIVPEPLAPMEQIIHDLRCCGNILGEFRQRADYTIINQTKQKIGDPIIEYRITMVEVFKRNSGLQNDNVDDSPYQQQLKNALLCFVTGSQNIILIYPPAWLAVGRTG
ncbi:hypothetical protein AMECASPLE_039093 [Ameca splendens]|uniref:Uncharacterized protein n=1 Tax=Ameca splendens TaxID=208324 RepID=A0ABV0YJV3_9TELE